MPPNRAILDGAGAPVAQSYPPGLLRRTPFSKRNQQSAEQKRGLAELRRRQQEEEDESGSDSSDSVSGDEDSTDFGVGSSSPSEESDEEPGEQTLSAEQERLRDSSPFSDFEVPTVPDVGPLPMPPLNTRRSMRLDKIKRRSRRTLSPRQVFEEESSSSDGDSGSSSESEDEAPATDGNAPPSDPPPTLPGPPSAPSPPDVVASQNPEPEATASAGSSITPTSTARQLNPPISRASTDNLSSPASSNTASITTITGGASPTTTATLQQSTFIAAADPTGTATSSPDSLPSEPASLQEPGPAPESRTAIVAASVILGVALLFTLVWLLFRYCVPVRTWYETRTKQRRDDKAARLGTAPSPWKWPLQFIFGNDRPAPPRRQQQQQYQQHAAAEYYNDKDTFNRDLESQPPNHSIQSIPVADGFRGPSIPPEYKSHVTTSGTSWVANGWRAPLSNLSQRLSNWPRRSGTTRWFFGGGASASRWSDSDAGNRTTYSEGQIVSMYGAGTSTPNTATMPTGTQRSSTAKSPLTKHTQIHVSEVPATPPLTTTTIIKPPRAPTAGNLGLTQTPIRARASPRGSYAARSSVATTASSGTGYTVPERPPAVPAWLNLSHFSASTVDPATPRYADSAVPPDVPRLPDAVAGAGMASRRSSVTRFPVRTSSMSSVSSVSSLGSRRGGEGGVGMRTSESMVGLKDKPLPPVGMARGSGVGVI